MKKARRQQSLTKPGTDRDRVPSFTFYPVFEPSVMPVCNFGTVQNVANGKKARNRAAGHRVNRYYVYTSPKTAG